MNRISMYFLLGCVFALVACGAPDATSVTPPNTANVIPSPAASPTQGAILQGVGAAQVETGRQLFLDTCAVCHGESAEGYANELAAPALNSREHASEHADQQIHDWIVNGKLGLGRQMPPYGEQLNDAEVHAVIAYLHILWTPEQLAIQQDLSRRWPATPELTWTPAA